MLESGVVSLHVHIRKLSSRQSVRPKYYLLCLEPSYHPHVNMTRSRICEITDTTCYAQHIVCFLLHSGFSLENQNETHLLGSGVVLLDGHLLDDRRGGDLLDDRLGEVILDLLHNGERRAQRHSKEMSQHGLDDSLFVTEKAETLQVQMNVSDLRLLPS